MSQPNTIQKIKIKETLKTPKLYQVIYVNDDVTRFDFVILTLQEFFNYSEARSIDLAQQVHEKGAEVVAVLPHEIAEQRSMEVMTLARSSGFPLEVRIQAEE